MKKFNPILALLALSGIIALESCSKGGSSGGGGGTPPPPPPPAGGITVTASKTNMFADNWDEVTFTVKDQNGTDVTSASTIYINNVQRNGNLFWTTTPGTYKVKASKSGVSSTVIDVVAADPGPSPFSQKILVEDYTGTWCGHCPRVGMNLEAYANGQPNAIVIANHGPSNDPYTFSGHQALANNIYGHGTPVAIQGYPTAVVDRAFKWNEQTSQLNTQFTNRRAPVGLGFSTSVNGNLIDVTARVKFDVNTNADIKIVAFLVEDGKVYPQVNYNYFGLPNPIANYVHNGIMRAAGTHVHGDLIPKANQVKGQIFSKVMQFNATGFNVSNCRIVAFAVVGNNNQGHLGVLNVQSVKVGENKDFD